MLELYKKVIAAIVVLLVITSVFAFICIQRIFVNTPLLPAHDSVIPWKFVTFTDVTKGGTSSVSVNESDWMLDYDYILTKDVQYPHVTAVIAFAELENAQAQHLVDLTRYNTATLRVRCKPRNVLSIHLHSFDPQVTDPGNFSSYRIAEALASCDDEWSDVEIDLRYLNVRDWWLQMFNVETSDQRYWLNKVVAFSFGVSLQGPANIPANVKVNQITLHGRDWRYVWLFVVPLVLLWSGFAIWVFKHFTQSLIMQVKDRLLKDRPLIAYQQLSIEPHKDKEKGRILRFMATEYANPDLSLETAITTLGISRVKINEVLKEELGFTFNTYLNKLRLTEAARLLSVEDEANIAEIAYSVGYNNVTYFNRLFKNEYVCTPKAFKRIYQSKKPD